MSKVEYDFRKLCQENGLPEPSEQLRFDPSRRWRLDWAFPGMIAVEIQGGSFIGGHHSRGLSQQDDWEKINHAQCQGWIVLQFSPRQIANGDFATFVLMAMAYRHHEYAATWLDRMAIVPEDCSGAGDLQEVDGRWM